MEDYFTYGLLKEAYETEKSLVLSALDLILLRLKEYAERAESTENLVSNTPEELKREHSRFLGMLSLKLGEPSEAIPLEPDQYYIDKAHEEADISVRLCGIRLKRLDEIRFLRVVFETDTTTPEILEKTSNMFRDLIISSLVNVYIFFEDCISTDTQIIGQQMNADVKVYALAYGAIGSHSVYKDPYPFDDLDTVYS